MTLRVVAPGLRTLVQDLGRPGLAHLGISASGALDPLLLRRANALVGNSVGAAGLEVLLGGLVLQAEHSAALAVVGGSEESTHWLRAGERFGVPGAEGLLLYVAVRGGVDSPVVLGSRSSDLLAGIGAPPLAAGDVLRVGNDAGPPEAPPAVMGASTIRLLPPPRPAPDLHRQLLRSWVVGSDSNRTAVRLDGPSLTGMATEVAPEGLVAGAVQVPPSGRPVVFLADHPVTGGYSLAGVVHSEDLRFLAQTRPGSPVDFTG
jgi:biotin-dependent carboxylase-like uncharacterized protein